MPFLPEWHVAQNSLIIIVVIIIIVIIIISHSHSHYNIVIIIIMNIIKTRDQSAGCAQVKWSREPDGLQRHSPLTLAEEASSRGRPLDRDASAATSATAPVAAGAPGTCFPRFRVARHLAR